MTAHAKPDAIEVALVRVASDLAEAAKALAKNRSPAPVHRQRSDDEVNQNQIISAFVRGAAWQLMRRSPTWLLLAIAAAWLLGGHHG
jgi:hypothetical protein